MLLSQQFQLLSTLFSQHLRVLRALLVKQGYFLLGPVEFVLNELGYSRMLLISTQSVQHGANGWPAYGRTYSFDRPPLKVSQMSKPFTRCVEAFWRGCEASSFFIQHVHVGLICVGR